MTDDLSAPLGLRKPARRPRKLTFAELHVVAGALGLSTIFLTGWMFLADKPIGRAPLAAAHTQVPDSNAAPIDADLRVIRLSPDDRPNVARVEAAAGRRAAQQDHHHHRRHERPRAGNPDPDLARRRPRDLVRRAGSNRRTPEAGAPTAALHQQFAIQRSQPPPRRTAGKPDAAVRVRASGN